MPTPHSKVIEWIKYRKHPYYPKYKAFRKLERADIKARKRLRGK